jgi:hypothetical protein
MRASHILVSGVVVLAIGVAMACNGKTTTGDSDGGPGPNASDCPSSEPAQDSSCSKEGLLCEYGTDFDPRCNDVRVCSGGKWATPFFPGGTTKDCPSKPLPTTMPNPADCASTRDKVPAGMMCSSKSTCAYDGSTCFCGAWCSSYPLQMPPCDGGVTPNCCDMTVKWHCFDGPAYCSNPRPRVGTACTTEGQQCATGAPVECGQSIIQCTKGVWNIVNTGCPISTRKAKKDIEYLGPEEQERLRQELLDVHLATYEYKKGDGERHLGFIIEDMPNGSPAVMPSREHVDLYGYTSMTVATIQRQQAEIDDLSKRLADLEKNCRTK